MIKILRLAALIVGVAPAIASANLVTNGSFEQPSFVGPSTFVLFTSIPGWTPVGVSVLDITREQPGLPASDGTQLSDLSVDEGYGRGIISDSIALTLGQQYHFSFDLASYIDGTTQYNSSVDWSFLSSGNTSVFSGTATNSSSGQTWSNFSYDWVATTSNIQLQFLTRNPGLQSGDYNKNSLLDNVSLTAVPVPASLWLLGSGLVGLFGLKKRKALA